MYLSLTVSTIIVAMKYKIVNSTAIITNTLLICMLVQEQK